MVLSSSKRGRLLEQYLVLHLYLYVLMITKEYLCENNFGSLTFVVLQRKQTKLWLRFRLYTMKVRYARVTSAPERRSYASHSEWQKSFPHQKKQGCFWIWSPSDKLWENLMFLLQRSLEFWLWYCTWLWCFTSEDGLSFEVVFFWRLSAEDSEDMILLNEVLKTLKTWDFDNPVIVSSTHASNNSYQKPLKNKKIRLTFTRE